MHLDGEWELWSVCNDLSLPLLPLHTVPLLQHVVTSTWYSPLRTAPLWILSTLLQEQTAPHTGHSFCQKPCSCVGTSPQGASPARSLLQSRVSRGHGLLRVHPSAPTWGPPWAADHYPLHCGPAWVMRAHPASPWSCAGSERESFLCDLEHLLPLLLHWPQCLQGCFSHILSLLSLTAVLQFIIKS